MSIAETGGAINEWRSTLVRLRQFEAELFYKQNREGVPRESRRLVRSRPRGGASWTSMVDQETDEDAEPANTHDEGAELRPTAEWARRSTATTSPAELHKRLVESGPSKGA